MVNKFCIQTLTHNAHNRGSFLTDTVTSFMNNTKIPDIVKNNNGKLDWFIRVNETNDEINNSLNYLVNKYSDSINFIINIGDNVGVGAGINFLNKLTSDYEYVLLLEGDWACDDASGISDNWLQVSLQLLDNNPDMHQIFLRRYTSDSEDRQHGMSEWILPDNVIDEFDIIGIKFIKLKKHCYTNNPTIRRLKTYFDIGVFPLKEYYDEVGNPTEIKGNSDWGNAEIEAYYKSSKLGTYWLWFGNFIHIDHLKGLWDFKGCDMCKYGFYSTYKSFCLGCNKDEDYTQLPIHQQRLVEKILPIIDESTDNPLDKLNKLRSFMINPMIDTESLLSSILKENQ
jgi:hypothetical protein